MNKKLKWFLFVIGLPAFSVYFLDWPHGGLGLSLYVVGMMALWFRLWFTWPIGRPAIVGGSLNILCIIVNKGMPYTGPNDPAVNGVLHHMATSADKLPMLWDRFGGFSIGDILLFSAFAFVVIRMVLKRHEPVKVNALSH